MISQTTPQKAFGALDHPPARSLRYVLFTGLLVACYLLAARAGLLLRVQYGDLTPLWPPSGIAVALLWRYGLHWWPVVVIGEFCTAISLGQPPQMGLIGGVAQSLEALAATLLFKRMRVQHTLSAPQQVCSFVVFGALLPPLLSASIGTAALRLYAQIAPGDTVSVAATWWLGDAMGILIITPFIVQWSRWPFVSAREFSGWLAVMLVLIVAGSSIAVLQQAHYSSLFYLLLPIMVVAAAHYGAPGATSTAVIMAALVLGMKLDAQMNDWDTAIKLAFIGTTAFAGYLLAAALAARRRSWHELALEQERALVTLRSIGDGVITTDASGAAVFMNPAAERITGWGSSEARGVPAEHVFSLTPILGSNTTSMLHNKNGQLIPIEGAVAEIRSPAGNYSGTAITFRDVSEERRLQDELAFQANHDALTGLHNRFAFERELRHLTASPSLRPALQGQSLPPAPQVGAAPLVCALLYLDLDQFKLVNDTCGHEAGDRLLAGLGARVRDLVSAPDLFARTGGDEFAVLLHNVNEQQALAKAELLRRVILDYRLELSGLTFSVGASIGIATFVAGQENAATVLSRADIACYRAKEEGRNRICLYRSDDHELVQRHDELERASQLHAALRAGRFKLHCQRIVALQTPAAAQAPFYEVLLRLQERDALIPPSQFMPAAERFGFVSALDHWVIEEALRMLGHNRDVHLGVNLAASTLNDPGFYDFVMQALARSHVDAGQICFEITEKVAVSHLTRAVETIGKLRAHGFSFALDDFGSGVASFGYLQELPVDYVKIDGRFVQDLQHNPASSVIVEALTKLAELKGIRCIAESVESESMLRHLARQGIAFAQGFHLHRPEPLDFA